MTGRARAVEDCAWAARNKAQPQKKMPLAAAPLRKSRRAIIACTSLQVQTNNPRNCFTGATVRDSVSLIRVALPWIMPLTRIGINLGAAHQEAPFPIFRYILVESGN
jgi:hypothetical protein